MTDLSHETLRKAKEIAPWRSDLKWWVILVEGIVLGIVGLLVLVDVQRTNANVALIFTAALALAGLLQLWAVARGQVPEDLDSLVSGRAAIAVFAGLSVLLLYFLDKLTQGVGLILVGLASLLYGLLGFVLVFRTDGARKRSALIETILFSLVGALMIYTQFAGATAINTALTIIGGLVLLLGIGLIIFAFLRRSESTARDQEATADVETAEPPAAENVVAENAAAKNAVVEDEAINNAERPDSPAEAQTENTS
jgi:uncharacterized membrane protein HdeD (DUF308 family)